MNEPQRSQRSDHARQPATIEDRLEQLEARVAALERAQIIPVMPVPYFDVRIRSERGRR